MTYDLKSTNLPVLKGFALKAFARIMSFAPTRNLLLPKLKKDGGFPALAEKVLNEAPKLYPTVESGQEYREMDFAKVELDSSVAVHAKNSVRSYRAQYAAGSTGPVEVVKRCIDAVKQANSGPQPMQAVIKVNEADLLQQAEESAKRLEKGQARSVLEGVPVVVKDELDVAGYSTSVGTAFFRDIKTADATLVSRMRQAGAMIMGKANMHEIGINPNGFNLHNGPARNPHNLGHDTGGSSSGSAAAVAAGFSPIALGADGGGSIRIPAALCGVIGLKGTFGRFSEYGVAPLCWSVAHVGPITATVEDAVLAYQCIGGKDPGDERTLAQGPLDCPDWNCGNLDGVKIGVFRPWFEHADREIVTQCQAMLDHFAARGADVVEVTVPELDPLRIAHAITILSEMRSTMENHKSELGKLAPSVRLTLEIANGFSSRDYVQAQKMRARAMTTFAQLWETVDLLVTPTTALTAPKIPEDAIRTGWSDLNVESEMMRFIIPGNMVGMPGISFPVGLDQNQLPVGMQVMANHWREDLLFRAAHIAEQQVPIAQPQHYYDLLKS